MKQTTKNGDLLQSQTSVENQYKESSSENEQLVYRQEVEGTPFHIVGTPDEGYFTAMGKYAVTHPSPTIAEQEQKIENKDWMLILSCMRVVYEVESIAELSTIIEEPAEEK